jgi:hypothetical protein
MVACLFVFRCFFFRFGRIVHLKMSSLGEWPSQHVVSGMIFGPFFHLFSLVLEARSTLPRRLLTDTRHPTALSVVFRPCHPKIWSCRSPEIGAWCPRAWELSAVWCACGPCSAFFQAELGGNRLYGVERPSGWHRCRRVSFTRRRSASWLSPPLPAACFG